ncbi:MAG: tail fiber domain-containing protein [Chitinophagales bacterium]|nr:tail fiber domain-containing protein [Bacteroidota bacterium]MCB9042626.1 tail fiber domain-containing protein [Chitinophagales bacterium]
MNYQIIRLSSVLCCLLSMVSVSAQTFILDVYGDAKIEGKLDIATPQGQNIYIGTNAGYFDSLGVHNVALGIGALYKNGDRSDLVAIGDSALYNNGIGATLLYEATNNTAVGSKALYSNTTGNDNTANGELALYSNTTGNSNIAIGVKALYFNTTGKHNTANGKQALIFNTSGNYNNAIGGNALYSNTTGVANIAQGYFALESNTTGWYNIGIGNGAIKSNTTGNGNTGIGTNTDVSVDNLYYASAFGYNAITNAYNKHVIGRDVAGTVIGGYVNWSNLSDGRFKENVKEDVPGMAFIGQLRPVTYTVDLMKLQKHITAQMPDSLARRYYPSKEEEAAAAKEIRTGFIAQEVEAVAQSIGYDFEGVNAPTNPTDNYSIAYASFVPSLVKALQEQQADLSTKTDEINELRSQNQALATRLSRLEALLGNETQSDKTHTQTILLEGDTQNARLEQNIPNPFNGETTISYYLPENSRNAELRISNTLGQVVKVVPLSEVGKGEVKITTRNLPNGTYWYELWLNNQRIDTKTMVLQQ